MDQGTTLAGVVDAGVGRIIAERAVAIVVAERGIITPVAESDPAIGHDEVLMRVVVVVEEGCAPAPAQLLAGTRVSHARRGRDIGKRAVPIVAVQAITGID